MKINIPRRVKASDLLFWLGFTVLVSAALWLRFYDLRADPANFHANGKIGYISESSSLPRDEQHYIKPVELANTIGVWVVDPPSHFDFNTPMATPFPQLQYQLVMKWVSRSIEAIRGFNSLTIVALAVIFVMLAAQIGASRTGTLLALSLFISDFLFFSYNRLAHMETQLLLWSALALLLQNYAITAGRTINIIVANILVGGCFGALLLIKANVGALFGLSFALSLLFIYARQNIKFLLKQTIIQFSGFLAFVLMIFWWIDIPLQFYEIRFSDVGRSADLYYTRLTFDLFDATTWKSILGQIEDTVSLAAFYEAFYYYFHVAPVPAFLLIFFVANIINSEKISSNPSSFTRLTITIFFGIYLCWFSVADYLVPRYFCHLIFFSAVLLASLKDDVWGSERLRLLPYWIALMSVILAVQLYPDAKANSAPETETEFFRYSISIGLTFALALIVAKRFRPMLFRVLIIITGCAINAEQLRSYQFTNPSYVWYTEVASYVGEDSLFNRDIRILNGVNNMGADFFAQILSSCGDFSEVHFVGDQGRRLENRIAGTDLFSRKSLKTSTVSPPGENTCVSFQNAVELKKLSGGNFLPWYRGPGVRIVYTEELVGREFDPTYGIFGFR